jgi:hypothetical protein
MRVKHHAGRSTVLAILAVFAATTFYYVLVALQVIDQGSVPGKGTSGSVVVGWLSAAAVVGAACVAGSLALRQSAATPLTALLAPAAAVLMVAYFYTYDSYFLPSLVRHSEKEFVTPVVVFVIAALAVGVGLLTLVKRPLGLALTGPAVVICGLTASYSGLGH